MNITPKQAEFFEKLCALCEEYKCEIWTSRENKQNYIKFEFDMAEDDSVTFKSSGMFCGGLTVEEVLCSKTFKAEKHEKKSS